MDASVSVFFCHRDTNTRASYDLPQTCLPEKAFSHAKGFCLLPVIKMEICKQRLDTNNSVICELVSICCESDNINKAYDLHQMSSTCTICMENNFLAQYLPIVVYTPILLENHCLSVYMQLSHFLSSCSRCDWSIQRAPVYCNCRTEFN